MSDAVRVLLAEDEEHLGAILEAFLAGRGHRVHRVGDGRAAVGLLQAQAFDVALLDVNMPELDGLDVLRAMAALDAAPAAVVMTGNATADLGVAALGLGAYDYVTKPYRMADVEALVRRAAAFGRLQRENARLRARLRALDPAALDDVGGEPPGAAR